MKPTRLLYWITTALVAAVMLWSALYFSSDPAMKNAFSHLGLPAWFRVELTIAKILGVLAMVLPGVPSKIREFAYFGFAIVLVSAVIAHFASGDGPASLEPLIFLALLAASYLLRPGAKPASHLRKA